MFFLLPLILFYGRSGNAPQAWGILAEKRVGVGTARITPTPVGNTV